MKHYLLQYKDEDGVQWTSFSSLEERKNFIKFHESEVYEKFEVLQETEKYELKPITDLVIDSDSYLKIMKLENYVITQETLNKDLVFTNLNGVLKKGSVVNKLINNRTGKKKLQLNNVVITFESEEKCFIESIFLNEKENFKENKYVVVLDSNHLYVKEFNPIHNFISGKCSFGGCLELIQFIRQNIKL